MSRFEPRQSAGRDSRLVRQFGQGDLAAQAQVLEPLSDGVEGVIDRVIHTPILPFGK